MMFFCDLPLPDDDAEPEAPEVIFVTNNKPAPIADLGPLAPTFEAFVRKLRARLEQGAREYGDSSFDRPTAELFDEIEEELLDITGWTVVLLHRLHRVRAATERITATEPERPND